MMFDTLVKDGQLVVCHEWMVHDGSQWYNSRG